MSIQVNKVYQTVLALANKEQRGYITPQSFNLFAEQAQLEIIDQYFYDLNQYYRVKGNEEEFASITDFIEEKIGYLSTSATFTNNSAPSGLYKLGTVYNATGAVIEQVSIKEYETIRHLNFLAPTAENPVFYWKAGGINIRPAPPADAHCTYVPKPSPPKWGYVVINNKPLYEASRSTDFSLHYSEEPDLIYRILLLAGVSIQKPQLTQVAAAIQAAKTQQEKQ